MRTEERSSKAVGVSCADPEIERFIARALLGRRDWEAWLAVPNHMHWAALLWAARGEGTMLTG